MSSDPSAPSVVVDPGLGSGRDPLLGRQIGGYVVQQRLSEGGMGTVYLAQHQTIGRKLAVKFLKPERATEEEWTRRFLAEAQVVAALKHRNLVQVFDFGQLDDGYQYLMMEYLEGESLASYIEKHAPLAPAQALEFVDQILAALGEAHKKGIVHRDLKPANVMLLREHDGLPVLKVLDFGLARQGPAGFEGAGPRAEKGSLLAGTPEYVAPEQAMAEVVDGRADLYALGVMLFELLTGRLPFQENDAMRLVQQHLTERPPSVATLVSNLPSGVEELVSWLLAKERFSRPDSADAARVEVQRILKQLRAESTAVTRLPIDPTAQTDKIERPTRVISATDAELRLLEAERRKGRRQQLLIAALLLLLLLGGVSAWWFRGQGAQSVPVPVAVIPTVAAVVPVPAVIPTPAPIDAGVPAGVDTKDSGADLTPLPAVAVKPIGKPDKKDRLTVRMPLYEIREKDCIVSQAWKDDQLKNVAELNRRLANDSARFDEWERFEVTISREIETASTPGDCVQVMRRIMKWTER